MLNYKIDMLGGIFYQKDVFASLQTTRLFYFVRQKIVVRVYQYNILEVWTDNKIQCVKSEKDDQK